MKSILSISILLTCASAFANAAPAASVQLLPTVSLMPEGQVGPTGSDARIAVRRAARINLLPEGQVGSPSSDDAHIARGPGEESETSIFYVDPEGQVGSPSDDD